MNHLLKTSLFIGALLIVASSVSFAADNMFQFKNNFDSSTASFITVGDSTCKLIQPPKKADPLHFSGPQQIAKYRCDPSRKINSFQFYATLNNRCACQYTCVTHGKIDKVLPILGSCILNLLL